MGRPLSAPVFALWCLFLLWEGWPTRADLEVSSIDCYSDYDTSISCEWKMNRPTSCSSELWLYYERSNDKSSSQKCSPKNKRDNRAALSLECVCQGRVDGFAFVDAYHLKIQSNTQILWEQHEFFPSENVKPRAPGNVVLSSGIPKYNFILTWDSTYSSDHLLADDLEYMVEIQNKENTTPPIQKRTDAVSNLTILAHQLENKSMYTARVKSKVSGILGYKGQWSDWSRTVEWYNEYEKPPLSGVELGVPILCILILLVNLLCYIGVIKIKKVWWDQIPNPAHSRLTAIIIQNQQLAAWRKLPKAKENKKFPHWKTCLSKLFPCLFSHNSAEKEEDTHLHHPSKQESWPMEACRCVLVPEKINVVQSIELCEAEVESEEGDADDVSFSLSPENSTSSFIKNKEALADKFVQMLFLDLIGEETFMPCSSKSPGKYKDLADATESPPKENKAPSHCRGSPTKLGSPIFQNGCLSGPHISERSETLCQSPCMDAASPKGRQSPEPHQEQQQFPSASQTEGIGSTLDLANVSISEAPQVDDNPAYRSFSSLLAQSLPRTEEELSLPLGSLECSWEQMAPWHGDPDLQHGVSCSEDSQTSSSHDNEPPSLSQSEGESWEEILRERVLRQEGDVICPTILTTSGYRCFDNAVKQGNDQNYKAAGFNVSKESGYRSFASLLNDSRKETSAETSGDESESGKETGGYKPLENLISPSQEAKEVTPLPLFTFGLDLGEVLPQKCQHNPVPSSFLKMYSPQETSEEETGKHSLTLDWDGTRKHEDTPEESSVCSKLDFSSGIVYSTLTCHLCGHLKRCPSPDENYTPLGNAQSTKCNCMVEVLETLPHPLTKATNFCPSEIMESPESRVPRTSSVEFLGESHLEEESSLGISVSLLSQDCEDPLGSTSDKWKGSLHLKPHPGGVPSPGQPSSPNMVDREHEGNTYMKVS
ncbi:interleukin-4 receptor subunit alpha [Trichosurus vulpecula]|uniref:interleukin-4 receptor subunit alpha n=1 Tax=Trichosurus vulpecula TaxID=9337 RepID=UPI00186AE5AE|nr:interleukin-4 receptor subunit alpha [Trichosurus vulpecula]XP_036594132.1 interleukin-4 receptor subunit alpha [Trichosurus vulpecula]